MKTLRLVLRPAGGKDGAMSRGRTRRAGVAAALALVLVGPLALGAAPRCAPPSERSCCAGASSCCCGDAGECSCRAGDDQAPIAPAPAAPQRAGDELRPEPVAVTAVAAAPAAGTDGPGDPLRRCEALAELPPPPSSFVLRC